MSTSNNSINRTIGAVSTNDSLSQLRATSGLWQQFDDQTDIHGYYSGVGSPEGVVAADIGSIYTDTGAGASGVYYKTTDTVNTGWILTTSSSLQTVQMTESTSTTPLTTNAVIPFDNTIPQITEGTSAMTHTHTALSATNLLVIECFGDATCVGNNINTGALFIQPNANAIAASQICGSVTTSETSYYMSTTIVAGTTAAQTFEFRFGTSNGGVAVSWNSGVGGGAIYGAARFATIRVTEYAVGGPSAQNFSVVSQTFTTPGAFTYTPTAGMQYVEVELVGAGGGGGGVPSTAGALVASASGGGAGGYARFILSAAQVGVSLSGSVGSGGAGGAAGNNNGVAGGNTTLATGAAWTVGGGGAGQGSAAGGVASANGAAGGTITTGTGDLILTSMGGASSPAAAAPSFAVGTGGGYSILGIGGNAIYIASSQSFAGNTTTNVGGGGSGAVGINTATARAGGNGADGIAIFKEYVIS